MPRCKNCKQKFEPKTFLQKYCTELECIKAMRADLKRLEQRKWNKEKKVRKERLKSRSEHLNDLQKIFNAYIRERDKDLPCVSCGARITVSTSNASHYFSVGAYPALRFDEDNVHASCIECNMHKSGNIAEYTIRLPERIGKDRFEALQAKRKSEPLKLTVEEIKEMQEIYKKKIKNLQK